MKEHGHGPRRLIVAVTALTATVAAASDFAYVDNADAIDHRQHIMTSMGEQVSIIGMILEGRAPEVDFATHARVLAIMASTAKDAFEPNIPGGDAKPEIWAEWQDFAQRLDELAAATDKLAGAAEEGGVSAAGPLVEEALTCKSCHDKYRSDDT